MAKSIEGNLDARGLKIGIVVSRFKQFVTAKLLEGALDGLMSHGGEDDNLTIVRVPGGFEIPLVAQRMVASGRYDDRFCLGAVIRCDMRHLEYVSYGVSWGIVIGIL